MENHELINKVSKLKILVVGDIMLDKYVIGNVNRISPEAPVPIVDVQQEYCTLGGCGNVAKNLSKVGVQTICVAACGVGPEQDKLINLMRAKNINAHMINCRDRVTTIKERIISGDSNTQLLRIDRESTGSVKAARVIGEIIYIIGTKMFIPDIILVSDYNKGVITETLMLYLEELSYKKGIKLIIDPKPENKYVYNQAYAITPNSKEFKSMDIWDNASFKNVIVTMGSDGVLIHKAENFNTMQISAEAVEVFNVTGAGDSFVAIFSICVGLGIDVVQSCRIANKCAAYVVTKPGTAVVPPSVFMKMLTSILPKEKLFD
jgi:rfaE bifunctional protein kinase chain/domain